MILRRLGSPEPPPFAFRSVGRIILSVLLLAATIYFFRNDDGAVSFWQSTLIALGFVSVCFVVYVVLRRRR